MQQLPDACTDAPRLHLQDIFTLFYLDRPFKFVSKTSNFLIPIVGWSMFLTGRYLPSWLTGAGHVSHRLACCKPSSHPYVEVLIDRPRFRTLKHC